MQQLSSAPIASAHAYRHKSASPSWWRLFYVIWSLYALYLIVKSAWEHDAITLCLFMFVLLWCAFFMWLQSQTLLLITPDGFTYYAETYVLSARWKDVEGIGRPPQGSLRYSYGLLVRYWEWQPRRGLRWMRQRNMGFIPLRSSGGIALWEKGVDDELRYYVP